MSVYVGTYTLLLSVNLKWFMKIIVNEIISSAPHIIMWYTSAGDLTHARLLSSSMKLNILIAPADLGYKDNFEVLIVKLDAELPMESVGFLFLYLKCNVYLFCQ